MPENKPALVFLSHATEDQGVAEALGDLLTTVSLGVLKIFRSSDRAGATGIRYGEEYFGFIFNRLKDATDVVCILTDRNVDRPWILYEAGVARGYGDVNVYALTINTTPGEFVGTPFSHFQNVPCSEGELTQFVIQLLKKHLPLSTVDAVPLSQIVRDQVQRFMGRVAELSKGFRNRMSLQETLERVERILTSRGLQTTYVGQYPEHFDTQVCGNLDRAEKSVQIACDYPAYGFLTNHDLYKRYKQILFAKATALFERFPAVSEAERSSVFSLTVSAAATRADLIRYPVPESDRAWEAFMSNERYHQGREALRQALAGEAGEHRFVNSPAALYTAIARVNQIELEAFPFPHYEVEEKMPIFAWIVDHSRAAFAIPTYLEGEQSIEHAFFTTDPDLIRALESIIDGYRRKALSPPSQPVVSAIAAIARTGQA